MKTLRTFALTALLAAIWLAGGYALVRVIGVPTPWPLVCGLANMVVGLTALLYITRDPHGWRMFYEGPKPDEPGYLPIGLLFALPLGMIAYALIFWLAGWIGRLFRQ